MSSVPRPDTSVGAADVAARARVSPAEVALLVSVFVVVMVVQTTSPLVARRSFWTVAATLEAVGLQTTPYHAHVPSFGEWGFIIAGRRPWVMPTAPTALPSGLRFLTVEGLPALLQFPPDMARVPMPPNRLSDQGLVATF